MFADMPLDNRTVNHIAALVDTGPLFGRSELYRVRRDLMFRPRRLFCNIEPKIRQYG
jgi:hypothetical protein